MPARALVMIVDDFSDALEMYQEYLIFKGYSVVAAKSGAEAIELAQSERPSVIFMDIRMPHMTGTKAMQTLRTDPSFTGVPIVALTAYAFEDERLAALAEGFDEVIPKPCNPDDLILAIERLVTVSSPPAASV